MLQAKQYHSLILHDAMCIPFFGYNHFTQKLVYYSEAHIQREYIREKCSASVAYIGNGVVYTKTLKM